jgi:hypothetical protein
MAATVRVSEAKRQAIKSRDSHFSALEGFVNLDLSVFLKQYPDYAPFAETGLAAVERMKWCREQLRKVWAGLDPAGVRLMILLGLKRNPDWKDRKVRVGDKLYRDANEETPEVVHLDPTFAVDAISWTEIVIEQEKYFEGQQFMVQENGEEELGDPGVFRFESFGLPEAKLMADWQTSGIRCEFKTNFQNAIYSLMQESWRAKICPICRKYFVAGKSAQAYCTHDCYVERKNKAALDYWKSEGKAKRLAHKREKV